MYTIIINNFIFLTFGLFYYFIGIFVKYLNLNIFESNLFTTLITINGFLTANLFIINDKIHPKDTLIKLYNLDRKEKTILYLSCIPFYKLIVLSYYSLDSIIIQLLNALRICINPIIYSIYYKDYYLYNFLIIVNIIINTLSCILPFIFNDNFSLKINVENISIFGILNVVINVILSSFCNIINEKFTSKYDFNNNYGYNTFIIYTFIITDILSSLIILPLIILIYYLINNTLDKLINFDNFYKILSYSILIGLFYGPYYLIVTKSFLHITSLNVCIMNNFILIISILLSCIINISKFYFLYIPSIILIFISSMIITYKINKLKN
jgi:hypothetical protein